MMPNQPMKLTAEGAKRPLRCLGVELLRSSFVLTRAVAYLFLVRRMRLLAFFCWSGLTVSLFAQTSSIDGTYELTERVMADGRVLRPPSIVALYTMADGRFSLNLFVKNADGTIASESSVGRYTFNADKYCEWIVYTIRNNLDKPGVTNEAPAVSDHCTPVTSKNGRFNFSPPGEGVEVSFGPEGFTARIGGEFVDHWRKIR
jgi:hypothetical protein